MYILTFVKEINLFWKHITDDHLEFEPLLHQSMPSIITIIKFSSGSDQLVDAKDLWRVGKIT